MDTSLDHQVANLAQYIMDEVPGEPSESQGAIDTAIRLLRLFQVERDALLEALKAVEWVPDEDTPGEVYCPWCVQWQQHGHHETCPRQAALRMGED
jgi:hypothetical protein